MKKATTAALLFALTITLAPQQIYPQSVPPGQTQVDKASADKLFRGGRKAFRKGLYGEAVKQYAAILDLDPANLPARIWLSYCYYKGGDYQSAFKYAQEVVEADPKNARAFALSGAALLRSGLISPAIRALNLAFALNPKEPMAHGAAAEIDYYEGRSEQSIAKALRAATLDPDEADYLITIARASSRLELYNQAAEAYERFLSISPETDKERRDRIRGLIDFYRRLAGVIVHEVSGAKYTEVPFTLGADRRPYIKLKINGRDTTFVIDTGSGFTVISKAAAKRLKITEIARGGNSQGVGGEGKFPIIYGLLNTVQFNDLKIRNVPCFIRPFHVMPDSANDLKADGFIGLSVLSRFLTELDYKDQVMRLNLDKSQMALAVVQEGVTVIPFRTTQNGLISIETVLDGAHLINAILDSGASSTVISTAAVDRLNLREKIIKGQTVRVIGAGGISDNVELLFLRHCRVADLRQDNLRALVLDFDAINETSGFEQSGILGGDFLRHFKVTIDFTRAQVVFRPYSTLIKKVAPEQKNQQSLDNQ
jgi:tetratricopeptide (TPR) repeat protein